MSNASYEGVGDILYQCQHINEGAVKRIWSEPRTTPIDRDGSWKQNYDPDEYHLVQIGQWKWKWNSAKARSLVHETELLVGVMSLSSQATVLADNTVVWLCDQAFTLTVLKRLPLQKLKTSAMVAFSIT